MREGQQFRRKGVFLHQVPVFMEMFGLGQLQNTQLAQGLFHGIKGVFFAGQNAKLNQSVKILRQRGIL
ncbi:MAG: hypothetical protein BWY71_02262 [Planctomycetes bacterium ADurb.Bin412]|nr:MAG: hypothetical protein BWY71_02262 [Planctomycetes bacterium ADurb.Bin412]